MKDIAPQILRQRLIIEARYKIDVDGDVVKDFLLKLPEYLNLKVYGNPMVHSTGGDRKVVNQGYDAFIPLIDSGISLYVWSNENFVSCIIFTCKEFSVEAAIKFLKDFFDTTELEYKEF